jgi:microcompartment protein CcmL/EutN
MSVKIFAPLVALLTAAVLGAGAFTLQLRGDIDEQRGAAADASAEHRDNERAHDALSESLKGAFDVPGE